MKMKKSKFILVPLLLFALILNTIPAFAASSESAAAAQDAEARQINTVTVTFTPSGLTKGIATVYASALRLFQRQIRKLTGAVLFFLRS